MHDEYNESPPDRVASPSPEASAPADEKPPPSPKRKNRLSMCDDIDGMKPQTVTEDGKVTSQATHSNQPTSVVTLKPNHASKEEWCNSMDWDKVVSTSRHKGAQLNWEGPNSGNDTDNTTLIKDPLRPHSAPAPMHRTRPTFIHNDLRVAMITKTNTPLQSPRNTPSNKPQHERNAMSEPPPYQRTAHKTTPLSQQRTEHHDVPPLKSRKVHHSAPITHERTARQSCTRIRTSDAAGKHTNHKQARRDTSLGDFRRESPEPDKRSRSPPNRTYHPSKTKQQTSKRSTPPRPLTHMQLQPPHVQAQSQEATHSEITFKHHIPTLDAAPTRKEVVPNRHTYPQTSNRQPTTRGAGTPPRRLSPRPTTINDSDKKNKPRTFDNRNRTSSRTPNPTGTSHRGPHGGGCPTPRKT